MKNLTINQFIKCKAIAELEPDVLTRNLKMVSIVNGKSVDELESLPIDELKKQLEKFNQIEKLTENTKVKMTFKIKGRRFEVIWRTQKLTSAQYIDVTSFCKNEKDIINNIHNILAAVCVEKTWYGKKLKYENHKEVSDLFLNNMSITVAYPIMLFFCNYFKELSANIQTYLEQEMLKAMNNPIVVEALKRDGDGLQS